MTEQNTCPCGRPAHDTTICDGCEARLMQALAETPAVVQEITTVLARQTKAGGAHVGFTTGGGGRPLPYDVKASEIMSNLRATLVSWTRLVLEENAQHPAMPSDDLGDIARWLLGQIPWLRLHDAAGDAVDEIVDAVDKARRTGLRERQERHYRGPCRTEWWPEPDVPAICLADLYARGQALASVTCTQCGARHKSIERRDWLLEQVEDQLYSQAEVVALLKSLVDEPVPQSTLATWIKKGRLVNKGTKDEPRYLLGEVLVLAETRRRPNAA